MKIKYKNEHLKAQVSENILGMKFLIVMELIGFFLCFLSFYHAYEELPDERGYKEILLNDHPVGLIFGITILIVNSLAIHWTGTVNVLKHLRPACGSVRYTPEEIDEQAELPESVWYPGSRIYITPKIIIGTEKGITAVEYSDIKKAYIRASWHIRRTTPYYVPRFKTKYREYYRYQLVIKTNNHKKLIMNNGNRCEEAIVKIIKERCGSEVWVDK